MLLNRIDRIWQRPLVKRLLTLIIIVLAAIPVFLAVWRISAIGQNYPVQDEWSGATVAIKTVKGSLTLSDLFQQHNEHRIAPSEIVTALVTLTTRWNLRVEMLVSVGLGLLIATLIVDIFRRQARATWPWLVMPATALLYALRNNANLIIGWQTQVWFVVLFVVLSVWLLVTRRVGWLALLLTVLCATAATFSFASGLLIWPLILVALWPLGYRNWRYVLFWALAATIVVFGLYLPGYVPRTLSVAAGVVLTPSLFAYYVLAYLGNPFVIGFPADVGLSARIGLIGMFVLGVNGLYLVLWKRRQKIDPWPSVGIWLILAGYSIGAAVLGALGRWSLFATVLPDQPIETRYVIHTIPFWLTLIVVTTQSITIGWAQLRVKLPAPTETTMTFLKAGRGWCLRVANGIVLFALILLYVRGNNGIARAIVPINTPAQMACISNYPFSHDGACLEAFTRTFHLGELGCYLDGTFAVRVGPFAEDWSYDLRLVRRLSFPRSPMPAVPPYGFSGNCPPLA